MDHTAIQEYYLDDVNLCYGCGQRNEHGLHLKSYVVGEETVAVFHPRPYHTAIPGYVYGGLIASLIDCHGTATAAAARKYFGESGAARDPHRARRPPRARVPERASERRSRSGRRLRDRPPPLAVVESIETQDLPTVGGTGFTIADTSRSDGGRTLASPDVAMCADCATEQRDPSNRRYRHAFVNCTNCGPRFTIIASLPYDRASTTMASFAMCAECAREYTDPADRRFHAQPVCCPNCGPALDNVSVVAVSK